MSWSSAVRLCWSGAVPPTLYVDLRSKVEGA